MMGAVSHGARPPEPSNLLQECGLVGPRPPAFAWPPDLHLAVAALAALPVWLALGTTVGARMAAPAAWIGWLSLVLVQPVLEELVFRGVLQGRLLRLTDGRRLGPVTLANLLATAGFVALHLTAQPPAWALAVAAPSLVFGHLRERFGSVFPAIAMHALYNAGFGLAAWLAKA